jgi:pilus assembly protein Flp/PilA
MQMLHTLQAWLIARVNVQSSERGAAMVEYGLLVALIAMTVAATALLLGNAIVGLFNDVIGQL